MMIQKRRYYSLRPHFLLTLIGLMSCTTTEISPPKPPVPPVYTQVPHPQGMNIGDLAAIFLDETAPKDLKFSETCDADYKKIRNFTESSQEINEGVRELVKQDPVFYHWCFYGKLSSLEKYLKSDSFLDEKQKEVLNTFEFIVPVARSFSTEFHDTRYLRWAVARYQHMSEWVFFRKLDLTPAGTMELVQPTNPFGLYRSPAGTASLLEKYHLLKQNPPETAQITPIPSPILSPIPLSAPTNLASPEIPASPAPETLPPAEVTPPSITTNTPPQVNPSPRELIPPSQLNPPGEPSFPALPEQRKGL